MSQQGADVLIDFGGDDSLLLTNMKLSKMSADFFLFT